MDKTTVLDSFHPAVASWFRKDVGDPTPPQQHGWPHIQAGTNTLICAPTGSGKTLAAFLAGIDGLIRSNASSAKKKSVQILYISPLKALNYDIERNLRAPLEGITREMRDTGLEPPDIQVGVRTGDTPSRERARMARKPPHILITTPESLNLILTSRAAAMLSGVRQVIVDEIHSLAPNKRGAFLSLLLERLEELTDRSPVRIGLSATQRPLEEVARFLGGYDGKGTQRQVTIVDAQMRKGLNVTVSSAVPDFYALRTGELWPSLETSLLQDVQAHRSTIVFANTRRAIERLTLDLNEMAGEKLVEPHHGSIAATRRKETEARLKSGDLKAVIATSSLELGIDMGAVDLVCQVGSPKSVAAGLQRVGRAGHLYGATSTGRIYATSVADLLEATVLARQMLAGRIEATRAVSNPLDVLAQQIAAMAAHGPVGTDAILRVVRRSACFHDLPDDAFWRTLEMAAGRLGKDFPPRVSLDRINRQVQPLPGTLRSVVSGGGVIPDTGQFPVYLSGTRLSIGELDEEFVWEAREGEAFRLGTSVWRIESIEADRIFVHPTAGVPAKVPFWRGESVPRTGELGREIGRFLDEASRFDSADEMARWIRETTPADADAACNLAALVTRQKTHGALPTHRTIVVERFNDALGEGRLAVITPYGSRVHQALRIALVELMRDETGAAPESMASDDGVLLRLPADFDVPAGIVRRLTPARFRDLLDRGLLQSPLFGLRFRQNAARALLFPPGLPGKRSPLWLQRLKAKDLLQMARRVPGFPVVAETIRECKQDYMDAGLAEELLAGVQTGVVDIAESSSPSPSPFASSMEFQFNSEFMYVWDRPAGAAGGAHARDLELADIIRSGERGIDAEALERLARDAQQVSEKSRARTPAELAETLRRLGDLSAREVAMRSATEDTSLLQELLGDGRVELLEMAGAQRYVLAEEADDWRAALADPAAHESFWRSRASAFIDANPGRRPSDFAARYGLDEGLALRAFGEAGAREQAVELEGGRWLARDMVDAARRITLAIRRRETQPVSLHQYQRFLFDWQHCSKGHMLHGRDGLLEIIEQLAGHPIPAALWESEVFSRRLDVYQPDWLDGALASGETVWRAVPGTGQPGDIRLFPRSLAAELPEQDGKALFTPSEIGESVLRVLRERGASFVVDIGLALRADTREVLNELKKLAWAGLVSQDGFGVFRSRHDSPDLKQAAARTRGTPRQRYQQLKRHRPPANPADTGRWALAAPAAEAMDEEYIEIAARLLLDRYGVLARDIARCAGLPVTWSSLYRVLERMELSGEIERGYYITDTGGAQFALPEAALALRQTAPPGQQKQLLNSFDPALVTEGPWVRRATTYVALLDGRPALLVEASARRLTPLAPEADALDCLDLLPTMFASPWPLRPVRRLELLFWGEADVSGHPVEPELRARGFQRTPKGLVLEAGPDSLHV